VQRQDSFHLPKKLGSVVWLHDNLLGTSAYNYFIWYMLTMQEKKGIAARTLYIIVKRELYGMSCPEFEKFISILK